MIYSLLDYFTPKSIVNKRSPGYERLRMILSAMLASSVLLAVLIAPLTFLFPYSSLYYIVVCICIGTLFTIKLTGWTLFPALIALLISYGVVLFNTLHTGGLFSPHMVVLHLLLLSAVWIDRRRIGYPMILLNIAAFVWISGQTSLPFDSRLQERARFSFSQYTLIFNICITIFFGIFLAIVRYSYECARAEIRRINLRKIDRLSRMVKSRTDELRAIRQDLATDFHDETGNLLAVINHQAQELQMKLGKDSQHSALVSSLLIHCEQLYNTSRDFIWSTHSDSSNPMFAFHYLTEFGQNFFNQFDIEFSAEPLSKIYANTFKLNKKAIRDLIAIFKEAMTNAAKHSNASQVTLSMRIIDQGLLVALRDNGHWKEAQAATPSLGLLNIDRRSRRNGFILSRYRQNKHTIIEIHISMV